MALMLHWALLAAPAPDIGSIYGKVNAPPSYYLAERPHGYARRMALPHASVRPPAGVLIALDGEPFQKEKFPLPTDEVKIVVTSGGFDQPLVGVQVGAPVSIENLSEKPIKVGTLFKDQIPPKDKKTIVLADTGVFELRDEGNPEMVTVLVVTANPFVLLLDDTGEFLFDELTPGNYSVRVFAQQRWIAELPVAVKSGVRETLSIPLTRPKKGGAK